MTSYIVLKAVNDNGWVEEKTVPARSARSAIRIVVTGGGKPDITYVAVPARSWQPVAVTVETKTQLKFQ